LNCSRCNRFNNYAFSGHYKWNEYAEVYKSWSEKLDVGRIGILGGEPMLNPEFDVWVEEIAKLWPRASILIITNGTQFHRWPMLYKLLEKYQGRVRIDINRHDINAEAEVVRNVEQFFPGDYKKFYVNDGYYTQGPDHVKHFNFADNGIKYEVWEDQTYKLAWRDHNQIFVRYGLANTFSKIPIERYDDRVKLVYWSDPTAAISICGGKESHHFLNGKLYKCNVSAILPNFIKQFDVAMTDQQKELIESYEPAEITWNNDKLTEFVEGLRQTRCIEQCRLCPDVLDAKEFQAGIKKVHIKKIQNLESEKHWRLQETVNLPPYGIRGSNP